jgi:hypothetical protein
LTACHSGLNAIQKADRFLGPPRAKAARKVIPGLVEQGLIKRMDLATDKFYVDGPLWEVFELDAKQDIVK